MACPCTDEPIDFICIHKECIHKNTTCCICGSGRTEITHIRRPHWYTHKVNGSWDYKSYECGNCHNTIKHKSHAQFRNKDLSRDCPSGKGFIGQQIFCKVRGVKDCNIELDNFNSKYDHSIDLEYGLVNTKYDIFKWNTKRWHPHTSGEYDNLAVICMDMSEKNVERVYIIPRKEAIKVSRINLTKAPSIYDRYRVDEKPYNEAYHSMSIKECPVLRG